ncbi:hypothetical protein Sru01_31190 [Sphaerisporangium rufum]|uniref:Putative restriction endonuclease domain-containing protein n=1 Tax=Sphaerisporangium rufum TaxID=1381558 RepID=A0A919R1U9_9ACTN|nr:Uma2 family endonuclease [Sphaerisporangium rufum]GII78137.1 hypothetical protein Sru01_31190 [Sphaerisporangium rufum]
MRTTDLDLVRVYDGYIPDLVIMRRELADRLRESEMKRLLPHHIDLVVEVTSFSTAADDHEPGARRLNPTKWNGYAYTGIPYYLLIDRDPRLARATLYCEPDVRAGTYRTLDRWAFGETIRLPQPFGFEIPTAKWAPWDSGA